MSIEVLEAMARRHRGNRHAVNLSRRSAAWAILCQSYGPIHTGHCPQALVDAFSERCGPIVVAVRREEIAGGIKVIDCRSALFLALNLIISHPYVRVSVLGLLTVCSHIALFLHCLPRYVLNSRHPRIHAQVFRHWSELMLIVVPLSEIP